MPVDKFGRNLEECGTETISLSLIKHMTEQTLYCSKEYLDGELTKCISIDELKIFLNTIALRMELVHDS